MLVMARKNFEKGRAGSRSVWFSHFLRAISDELEIMEMKALEQKTHSQMSNPFKDMDKY